MKYFTIEFQESGRAHTGPGEDLVDKICALQVQGLNPDFQNPHEARQARQLPGSSTQEAETGKLQSKLESSQSASSQFNALFH